MKVSLGYLADVWLGRYGRDHRTFVRLRGIRRRTIKEYLGGYLLAGRS